MRKRGGAVVDKARMPPRSSRRAVGRGSGMADVGLEVEAVEIQKGLADDRPKPGRMP
jgi:hypothetical protein